MPDTELHLLYIDRVFALLYTAFYFFHNIPIAIDNDNVIIAININQIIFSGGNMKNSSVIAIGMMCLTIMVSVSIESLVYYRTHLIQNDTYSSFPVNH